MSWRVRDILPPALIGLAVLVVWEVAVRVLAVPHYILPGPVRVAQSLVADWAVLWPALLTTGRLTLLALFMAVIGGVALAVAFTQSKWAEM